MILNVICISFSDVCMLDRVSNQIYLLDSDTLYINCFFDNYGMVSKILLTLKEKSQFVLNKMWYYTVLHKFKLYKIFHRYFGNKYSLYLLLFADIKKKLKILFCFLVIFAKIFLQIILNQKLYILLQNIVERILYSWDFCLQNHKINRKVPNTIKL